MDTTKIMETIINEIEKTQEKATPRTTYEVYSATYELLAKIETYNNEIKFYNSINKKRMKKTK